MLDALSKPCEPARAKGPLLLHTVCLIPLHNPCEKRLLYLIVKKLPTGQWILNCKNVKVRPLTSTHNWVGG